jgi:Uma2 family endonuclease
MTAALDQKGKRWTYEQYYSLESDQRYEVIDGSLLMVPGPDSLHQDWLGDLYAFIRSYVKKRKNLGRVFVAPLDVVLDSENVVQPDIVFVAEKNLNIIQKRGIFGIPDLVVEMISPSSVRRDRYEKMSLYARFGVKEYCIGDPANRSVEILTLAGDHYVLHFAAEEKGKLTSLVLTDLKFDLSELEQ